MSEDNTVDQSTEGPDSGAVEQRARELGWVPEEEFRGDKTRWKPADQFIEHAENVLPILRKQNLGMNQELQDLRRRNQELESKFTTVDRTLKALEAARQEDEAERATQTHASLLQAYKDARAAGDVDAEAAALDKLMRFGAESRNGSTRDTNGEDTTGGGDRQDTRPKVDPQTATIVQQWINDNDWAKDEAMLAYANGEASKLLKEYAARGEQAPTGRAFLDMVTARVEKRFNMRPATGKTETGRNNGPRSTGGTSFNDLPEEAKRQAIAEERNKVGANKRYKTSAEWRSKFAELYFSQPGARQ